VCFWFEFTTSIFLDLKIDNSTLIVDSLTLPVVLFQLDVFDIMINHPVNSTIYSILYILMLSSVISVVEVSFVSWNAAIVILIVWVTIIADIAHSNKQEIYNVDIAVSNIIRTLTSITFILSLLYTFIFAYSSLMSLLVPYWILLYGSHQLWIIFINNRLTTILSL
jgi:hypothetical protein